MKIYKKLGIVFWITGISGSGKTTLSKKIYSFIKKKFGPTVVVSGDNLRKIFKLNKYDIKYRMKVGKKYTNLLKLIIANKVNVLFSVVGLFHELHKYNRTHLKNYIEIFIDANFKKTELRNKKFFTKIKLLMFGEEILSRNIQRTLILL